MIGYIYLTFSILSSSFLKRISLKTETNLKQEQRQPQGQFNKASISQSHQSKCTTKRDIHTLWGKISPGILEPVLNTKMCYKYISLGVPSSFLIFFHWYRVSLCIPGWPGTQPLSAVASLKHWLLVYATIPKNSSSVYTVSMSTYIL